VAQNAQSQLALATAQWQGTLDGFQQALRQTQVAGATLFVEQNRSPETVVAMMTRMVELDAWTPVPQHFDSLEMVQVPPGCFLMGGTGAGDQLPLHEQCFDKPFWIDRYEVTNEQFDEQFDGVAANPADWPNRQQPRTSVTWSEARDFCELRGARLPTEAEWEYAARGPNSLVYPWGNTFVGDNVVGNPDPNNRPNEPADVGSKPGGVSWVGAYDMSGNVMEWTSTIYDNLGRTSEFPYPYRAEDGREDLERMDVYRVMRGGSFSDYFFSGRAAIRYFNANPNDGDYWIGFRCARSEQL
jgi:formylglycine-generating enzyme required for sulfatase activity